MRPSPKFLPLSLALVASVALAACGSSSSGSASSSTATTAPASTQASASSPSGEGSSATVKTASNATLGASVLTDTRGMTLYSLSAERNGKFICTSSACVGVWHPLSAPTGGAPGGSVGSLAAVKRPDGTEQVTYKGMPLYTFAKDRQPGDAKGQGLKDVGTWTAVSSGGASAPAAPQATQTQSAPSTPASSGGGGYGY
jgi:predicted lipoprotein with Yx(FWY)xxD motif